MTTLIRPPAATSAQLPAALDASGNLKVAEQYFGGWTYANLGVTAGTVVKSGAGVLHLVAINRPIANGTITLFDNTAASGTKIATITLPAAIVSDVDELIYDVAFTTGLSVITTGANMDITLSYS